MSIVPATSPIISPITSSVPISFKLIVAPVAFIKYQDLVLGTSGLNTGSHVIMHVTKTI